MNFGEMEPLMVWCYSNSRFWVYPLGGAIPNGLPNRQAFRFVQESIGILLLLGFAAIIKHN